MKFSSYALVFSACVVLTAGCKGDKLAGTWVQEVSPEFGNPPKITLKFSGHGSFEAKVVMPEGSIVEGGSYTTDGKSVTFTIDKYDMNADDVGKQMRMNGEKSKILDMLKKPITSKLVWNGPNKIEMDAIPGPLMFGSIYHRE